MWSAAWLAAPLPCIAQDVPPPFAPLETRSPAEGVLEVRPWGRTYRFERGPLPVRIVSQQTTLFTEAPRWKIDLGKGPVEPRWSEAALEEAGPRSVTLRSRAEVAGGVIRARTLVEYDGMIRVDLEVTGPDPEAPFALKALRYELPLDPEVARWFNHHVSYDYARLNIDKAKLLASAGRVAPGSQRFEYTPTFFLGNHEVGIEWWSDENLAWKTGGEAPIAVERSGEETILRVAPVSAPLSLSDPWRHRFALFPAPMRPPKPGWRSKRFISPSAIRLFESKDFAYYWIAFPNQMSARYHGLPEAVESREQQALRDRLRQQGIGYIPYGKLMAAPSYHPETLAHEETWPANRRLFTGPTHSEAVLMEEHTDWKRGEWYGYNVCAARTDYFDWMLAENLKTLREEETDGIYFDFGSISSICETDPQIEGRTGAEAWHYFELRDFYKRLYEAVQAERPDALITIHTNGQPRALTAWVDYNFVGEALNALFRNGRNWKQVTEQPNLYDSDYFRLSPGFLMAQTQPLIGGITSVLPQLHKARLELDPEELLSNQRGFLAQVLVNDTHFWFGNADHAALVRTIAALDRFGPLDAARFEPWWGDQKSLHHQSELRVSTYRRPGALLAVVANWTDEPREARLRLNPEDLAAGLDAWRDLEHPEPRPGRVPKEGFVVRVPAHDFRLIAID